MKKTAALTGVKMDQAMYLTRVITFKFAANGRSLSLGANLKNTRS